MLRGKQDEKTSIAIHSKHSFWTLQKDQASLSAPASTTRRRPVQIGRLQARGLKSGFVAMMTAPRLNSFRCDLPHTSQPIPLLFYRPRASWPSM
jgi:hypothetical protein